MSVIRKSALLMQVAEATKRIGDREDAPFTAERFLVVIIDQILAGMTEKHAELAEAEAIIRDKIKNIEQARRVLMQQCFIPMWDTDAAAECMGLISILCRRGDIYRVVCGPGEEDARKVAELLYHRRDEIMEEEPDMKIKKGFVLRNTAGEYVVMPTGQNITEFDGTIVLNEVAAFVWSKMAEPVTRNELVEYILSEYEIDRATAERDLDALIDRLNSYGVLEDC